MERVLFDNNYDTNRKDDVSECNSVFKSSIRNKSNNVFQEPIFLAHRVSLFIGNRGLRGCVNETAGVLSGYAVENQCLWKEAV